MFQSNKCVFFIATETKTMCRRHCGRVASSRVPFHSVHRWNSSADWSQHALAFVQNPSCWLRTSRLGAQFAVWRECHIIHDTYNRQFSWLLVFALRRVPPPCSRALIFANKLRSRPYYAGLSLFIPLNSWNSTNFFFFFLKFIRIVISNKPCTLICRTKSESIDFNRN